MAVFVIGKTSSLVLSLAHLLSAFALNNSNISNDLSTTVFFFFCFFFLSWVGLIWQDWALCSRIRDDVHNYLDLFIFNLQCIYFIPVTLATLAICMQKNLFRLWPDACGSLHVAKLTHCVCGSPWQSWTDFSIRIIWSMTGLTTCLFLLLIIPTLCRIQQLGHWAVLVTSRWSHWFPLLLSLVVWAPWQLLPQVDLLSHMDTEFWHPQIGCLCLRVLSVGANPQPRNIELWNSVVYS